MFKNLFVSLAIVAFAILSSAASKSVDVKIKGMTCGSCEEAITEKLKVSDKFAAVKVNHEKSKASLTLKDNLALSQAEVETEVKKLLEGTDYEVIAATAKKK